MLITHASHHSWYKNIEDDLLNNYSRSDRKKLEKAIETSNTGDISVSFRKADEEFFTWFTPLYNEVISQKHNPLLFDIKGTTINKNDSEYTYRTLTLKQGGEIIGGCIFSCWSDRFSIAYRIYKRDWHTVNLPVSPALYGEFLMDKYSKKHNKLTLTHGLDRNPYGINSSIGLAMFKLSVGCKAKLRPKHLDKFVLDTTTLTTDTLVLHYPNTGDEIIEATLICSEENQSKYVQLDNYSSRLKINKLLR